MDPFSLPALVLALIVRTMLIQPFSVPAASMVPTLDVGDYVIATKYSYGYDQFSLQPPMYRLVPAFQLFRSAPSRGDIVFFASPGDPSVTYVKRVIGIAGDKVQVRQGITYLNGVPLQRERLADYPTRDFSGAGITAPHYLEALPDGKRYEIVDVETGSPGDDTKEFVVPAGHCFVMGDNRDNSLDSRFGQMGFVPYANIFAKALIKIDYSGPKLKARSVR